MGTIGGILLTDVEEAGEVAIEAAEKCAPALNSLARLVLTSSSSVGYVTLVATSVGSCLRAAESVQSFQAELTRGWVGGGHLSPSF